MSVANISSGYAQLQSVRHPTQCDRSALYLTAEATVVEAIYPARKGRIRIGGVLWYAVAAEPDQHLSPGTMVSVIDRIGTKLVVKALPSNWSERVATALDHSQ